MPTTTLDCALFRDIFGTARMRAVFDSRALLQSWLDTEAALAEAQAEVGVIPVWAAEQIREAADAERFDLDELRTSIASSQHPLVPAVRALVEVAGPAGQYVHWGTTTQDVMDTGAVLQIRSALDLIEGSLEELIELLALHTRRFSRTPMAGRTHGQHAVPITLGLKLAIWIDEFSRTRERLAQCRRRVLVGELGGAAGTLASLGDDAQAVRAAFCRRLNLAAPTTPWHTARDGFAELVSTLGILAATMEKIALEIVRLQSTEVGEVAAPTAPGHVGSSTMPQKQNPMSCEYIAAVSKLIRGLVPVMHGCMIGEHERDMGSWAAEWLLVPQALIMADGALTQLLEVTAGLTADEERMAANLGLSQGAILSEAVMLALGRHIGREGAHNLMMAVTRNATQRGVHLLDALREQPEVTQLLDDEDLKRLLEPSSYLGEAVELANGAADRATRVSEPSAIPRG